MGLFPILPLYGARFGATPTWVGLHFASMYAANSLGPVIVSRLAARLQRKTLFVLAAAVGLPALALLSRATAFWQVVLLTGVLWFSGGAVIAIVAVLTGLYASSGRRGASFSLMSLASPLGAVLGGLTVARLVTWRGYEAVFGAMTVVWVALPLLGLLLKEGPRQHMDSPAKAAAAPARYEPAFYRLLGIVLLSATGMGAAQLGRSLSMQAADFTASAVAGAAVIGGLAAVPVTLLIGTLADRLGRRRMLAASFLAGAAAAVVLAGATQLWQFWIAAIGTLIAMSASRGLSSAVATDILSPTTLNVGLPWVNATNSAAGIISFAGTGLIFDGLGPVALYVLAAALAVVAAIELRGFAQHRETPRPQVPVKVQAAMMMPTDCGSGL